MTGDIKQPDGDIIPGGPKAAKHPSLIEIPSNFVAQFQKMVEDRL